MRFRTSFTDPSTRCRSPRSRRRSRSSSSDGDTIALEGFTHLIPFAAGHEIIRQGRRDLTLVRMTPDIVYDQMIGMGCARRLVFSWGGNPGVGSLHRFRDAVENGWPGAARARGAQPRRDGEPLRGGRLRPALRRAPRLRRAATSSSTPPRSGRSTCPFTGEVLSAVSALELDVAVIHAQQADRAGNVQLWGIVGVQKEAVLCARRVLVTVEEIVDVLEPRPGAIVLPHWTIDYVVGGARRRAALLRARLHGAGQRLLRRLGRDQPRPRHLPALDGGQCPRGLSSADASPPTLDARRDDDRRRRTRPRRRGSLPRRASACRAPPRTSPGASHAPGLVLVYESGTIGAKPGYLPLSIGDGILAETADTVVGARRDLQLLAAVGPDRHRLPRRGASSTASPTSTRR